MHGQHLTCSADPAFGVPAGGSSTDAADCSVAAFSTIASGDNRIAGWRVGFCVGNASIVAALKKVKSYLDFGIFQPLQIAAIDVLEKAEEISYESASVYSARRDVLVSGLGKLGWEVYAPKATVFLWVRMPEGLRYVLAPGGGVLSYAAL